MPGSSFHVILMFLTLNGEIKIMIKAVSDNYRLILLAASISQSNDSENPSFNDACVLIL